MVAKVRDAIVGAGMMRGVEEGEAKQYVEQILVRENRWRVDAWTVEGAPASVEEVERLEAELAVRNCSKPELTRLLQHYYKGPAGHVTRLHDYTDESSQQLKLRTPLAQHEIATLHHPEIYQDDFWKSSPLDDVLPPRDLSDVPEWPAYLRLLASGELAWRAKRADEMWSACVACGRNCEVDRLSDDPADWGECRVGKYALVASAFPHFGEEDCLRGCNGSGTVFFGACNLKCCYCQNYEVSAMDEGTVLNDEQMGRVFANMQRKYQCHNVNFVSPTHNVAPIIRAVLVAAQNYGLTLPLVYNTGGYDSLPALRLLDGIIDVYMPDMKYSNRAIARKLSQIDNYPEVNQAAVKEMQRQVGGLTFNEFVMPVGHKRNRGRGAKPQTLLIARRGVLVRHLVLPNDLAGTRDVTDFLVKEVDPDIYVNVMDQYRPEHLAVNDKKWGLGRGCTDKELRHAQRAAEMSGVRRFDRRVLDW